MEKLGVLPQPIPAIESIKVTEGLFAGFPDMKIEILSVMVEGNQATVKVKLSGTQPAPWPCRDFLQFQLAGRRSR